MAPPTWSYALADASRENITALVRHPDVEDTHNIDRAQMILATGAFSAEGPGYQAPSLERVPRLYTLTLTFTGVAADELRPGNIDLVFVNTVTGQEVEARRVTSHAVNDSPAGDRPAALPIAREESKALFVTNRVGRSTIGMAVKDLSTAYLYDNRFEENGLDVRANMKQPFFGGGRVVFVGAGPRQADLSVDIDDDSMLTRMPAGAVERLNAAGMRPERVGESFSALSAVSEGP